MNFPAFYRPDKVGTLYVPNTAEAINEGREADTLPARTDQERSMLLMVDAQVDFVHEDGALSVPGAVEDTRRTVEWLFRNLGKVTTVALSLDSHIPLQIFFPTWWVSPEGAHPDPFTLISAGDVDAGRWQPVFEPEWSRHYVHTLEESAKKTLTIWPYHTMIGSAGHTITPALYEAEAFHSAAREAQPQFLIKGLIAKTEHYSIFEPEVKVPEEPQGVLNTAFIEMMRGYDRIFIAGQAKSHCVLETVTSLMRYFERSDPEFVRRFVVLSDCTSSVVHPAVDFEALANAQYAEFMARVLQMADSVDLQL